MAQEIPCQACEGYISKAQYKVHNSVFINCGACNNSHFICGGCAIQLAVGYSHVQCPDCKASISLSDLLQLLATDKLEGG